MKLSDFDTRLRPPPVFIVGCPRSGTTWVQLLLAQHDRVATVQETQLFHNYLGPFMQAWRGERLNPTRRQVGLSTLLTEKEFLDLCRTIGTSVLRKVSSSGGPDTIVVEKSPHHVFHWEDTLLLFPNATFIHVIRDPRSVVCSLRSAGRSWGRDWAPSSTVGCAETWKRAVVTGRAIRDATERYVEVRYEALHEDGAAELDRLLNALGLPAPDGFAESAFRACRFDRLKSGSFDGNIPWELEKEPEGMYRKGEIEAWREELRSSELRSVEYVTGDLMRELGYEPVSDRWRSKPWNLRLRDGVKELARGRIPAAGPVLERAARLLSERRGHHGRRAE